MSYVSMIYVLCNNCWLANLITDSPDFFELRAVDATYLIQSSHYMYNVFMYTYMYTYMHVQCIYVHIVQCIYVYIHVQCICIVFVRFCLFVICLLLNLIISIVPLIMCKSNLVNMYINYSEELTL